MSTAIYPSLAGKTVVITGGGTGIGAAFVAAYVRQNARVFFLDIAQAESEALAASLQGAAMPPVFLPCNLKDPAAITKAFAQIEAAAGAVQVLVNNAANDDRHEVGELSADYWTDRMDVNFRHHFLCAQAVMGGMKAAGQGVILNIGSISWHVAIPKLALYMAAKAGIEGLTRGLARDLGDYGIRVNCIVPGAVRTPRQVKLWQTPESQARLLAAQCLHQTIEPEQVAAMALFLSSDDASACTGREYFVDAGLFGA